MGEARRRGNFEERKAQAIEAGRVKGVRTIRQRSKSALDSIGSLLDPLTVMTLLGVRKKGRKRR